MPKASQFPITFFRERQAGDLTNGGVLSVIFSIGISSLLWSVLVGDLYFWNRSALCVDQSYLLLFGLCLSGTCSLLAILRGRTIGLSAIVFASVLILLAISDWFSRGYSFFSNEGTRSILLLTSIGSYLILNKTTARLTRTLLLISSLGLMLCFLIESNGRILFSDDHPTFLFRLLSLRAKFPNIPFYNTMWNGGFDARDFFATGSLNFFLLFAPIIYLTNLWQTYNLLIALLLFVLVPSTIYLAAKILGANKREAVLAGIIGMSSSLLWYRWALKYGTVGFITSSILLVINLALVARILSGGAPKRYYAISLITITLMLFWSPSGLVMLPAALLALFPPNKFFKNMGVLVLAISLAVLNAPWILLFIRVSKVANFVTSDRSSYSTLDRQVLGGSEVSSNVTVFNYTDIGKAITDWAITVNPLILLLALPGLALYRKGSTAKKLLCLTTIWLLFLGTLGAKLKPHLDLDRMLIMLALVLSLPTAKALEHLLCHAQQNRDLYSKFIAACCFGFLLASPLFTGSVLRNRSYEQYNFANSEVLELASAIDLYAKNGRTLFSGSVMHQLGGTSELNGGHLAPLTFLSSKPLMASSFLHNIWEYTDIIPAQYRSRGDIGVEEYLDLYNVSLVAAHERFWINYFKERPRLYRKVWTGQRFNLFQRIGFQSSYFVKGTGEIESINIDSIILKLTSNQAIIKFNYFPFLDATGCKLKDFKIAEGISFIEIHSCTSNATVTISSKAGYKRAYE